MTGNKRLLTYLFLTLGLCPLILHAQSIVVDAATEYQVIDGFGGMNHTSWVQDLNADQRAKAFSNDPGNMGLSILRVHIDPNQARFPEQLPTAQFATGQGAKVLASPWDPPTDLLDLSGDDPRLPYENYGAYVDHLNSFNTLMNTNGVPLYAISVQNEPDIGEWTDWTPSEILTFVKEFGQDIDTRVLAAESFNFNRSYTDLILNDADASVNVDIIGGHIYGNGLYDYPLARAAGKPVWMTEHLTGSDGPGLNNWALAMDLAEEIHDCMEANFNAYIWWYIRRFYGLIRDDGNISEKGYVMTHFSKFVRPGAIRVGADVTSLPGVLATAYKTDTSMTIVAINTTAGSVEVAFEIQNADDNDFTQFTSSAAEYLVNMGTISAVSGTFTLTLEAGSISTITTSAGAGGKYDNLAPLADAGGDRTVLLEADQTSALFTLDGSASQDPDGQIANYSWSADGQQLANSVTLDMTLSVGEHAVVLTVTDNDGARDMDTIVLSVESLFTTELWFEAECMDVGSTWLTPSDNNASNDRYVGTPSGTQLIDAPSDNMDDLIRIDFSVSEAAGYKVWGRIIAPNADDDSFWVKMDDSGWSRWNSIPAGSAWHWDDVHADDNSNPVLYNLAAGDHTLWICYREDGALLDKILIANTGITPTGEGGESGGCVIVDRTSEFWYEAECAVVGENWEKEESGDASNQAYAGTPAANDNLDIPDGNSDDMISFPFTVSEATEYQIWGRVLTPRDEENSFWVKMDDSEWVAWDHIPVDTAWHWDDMHDSIDANPLQYQLEEGAHTLYISYREQGTLIDKILITNTGFIPSGLGGLAAGCDIVERTTELWFEAECIEVGASWEKIMDDDASNQAYVGASPGTEFLDAPSEAVADQIRIVFSVTEETEYRVWGRVSTPSGDDDSFWVKMDDAQWVLWEHIPNGAGWHWDDVHGADPADAVSYQLTAGEHTLSVCMREDGALLDKVLIVNTGLTPVGNGGTAEACTIVGLNQIRIDEGLHIYPNPSNGNFHLQSGQGFSRLEILSLDGKILMSQSYGKPKLTEEVHLQLEPGIYLLRVSNKENVRFTRLVIQ
jgi:glucuronoarabinoxylan endo-1,4-beta-xylanase